MDKRDSSKRAKPENAKPYLELLKLGQTLFEWKGRRYSVLDAPPDIFDTWIRTYVDTILNVDTFLWDTFDRWQIINAVLDGGFLMIAEGNMLVRNPVAEEKTSDLVPPPASKNASQSASEGK